MSRKCYCRANGKKVTTTKLMIFGSTNISSLLSYWQQFIVALALFLLSTIVQPTQNAFALWCPLLSRFLLLGKSAAADCSVRLLISSCLNVTICVTTFRNVPRTLTMPRNVTDGFRSSPDACKNVSVNAIYSMIVSIISYEFRCIHNTKRNVVKLCSKLCFLTLSLLRDL
jgi:hypothetical protein